MAKPKGGFDASLNPNYPAATVGDFYRVTVAGKIGGVSGIDVTIGDTIHNYITSAAGTQAAVGSNWTIVQANVDQATVTTLGLLAIATQLEAEAKVNTIKALTPASLLNFPQKKTFNIGDNTATSFVITHGLGTVDVVCRLRKVSTGEYWEFDHTANSTTQVTLPNFTTGFGLAATLNEFVLIILG